MSELTKKALAAAAAEILRKKSLDKITIKEITDACGLTRNTFYYHFEDIYDLLGWMLIKEADEILKRFSEEEQWEEGFLEGLTFLYENQKMIYHIYKTINRGDLDKYLNKVGEVYALRLVNIQAEGLGFSREAVKTAADFYINAFVGTVLRWIENDMKESPEALAKLCDAMFKGTVKAALESAEEVIESMGGSEK